MCAAVAETASALCKEAIDLIDRNLPEIKHSGPQSIIFIGNTGVGKSSLINLIAGITFRGVYDEATDHRKIEADNSLPGMQIGHSMQSKTEVPHKWVAPDGVVFWDCPGFCDNRGPVQELVNAVCLKKLLGISPKVKIVVVIKDSDLLEPRADALMGTIRQLDSLFAESIGKFQESSMLIVSHALETRNVEQVKGNLTRVVQEIDMSDSQKGILHAFMKNPITVFPVPAQDGKILLGKEKVLNDLQGIAYAVEMKANIALSEGSQALVLGSYNMISKNIDQEIGLFLTAFGECIRNFATTASAKREKDKLQKLLLQLNAIEKGKDNSVEEIAKMVGKCLEIIDGCGGHVQKEKILHSITQLNTRMFLEQFIALKEKIEVFSKIQDKLQEAENIVQIELDKINTKEAKEKAEAAAKQAETAKKEAAADIARRLVEESKLQESDTQRIGHFVNKLHGAFMRHSAMKREESDYKKIRFCDDNPLVRLARERRSRTINLETNAMQQASDNDRMYKFVSSLKSPHFGESKAEFLRFIDERRARK